MSILSFTPSSRLAFSAARGHLLPAATCHTPLQRKLGLKPVPAFSVGLSYQYPVHLDLALRRRRFVAQGLSTGAEDLLHNAVATAAVLSGAYAFVFSFNDLTRRKLLHQGLSRKLVHILSGLLFLGSWPIFSNSAEARYFAAIVPLVNCLRLVVNGLSMTSDAGLLKSVTREGNPQELLRGPLYYVVILMLCTLLFWRDSPIGVVSLAMMCGGDGVADIIGRRFGSAKIPYNQRKSWAGSISMLVFGFLISIGMLYYYSVLGYMQLDWVSTVQRVALVSLVATMVESLPISDLVDDNISVPLATMAMTFLNFRH